MRSVVRGCPLGVCALVLAGCGYVGDPLPPSLHIPEAVTVLSATQTARGIEIAFVTPALTTDGLRIRELQDVELRIGPVRDSFEAWLETADAIDLRAQTPVPGTELRLVRPAQPWEGQEIAVAVRTVGRSGRPSPWSELQRLQVIRTLPEPTAVRAEPGPTGVRLTWPSVPGASSYRIVRQEGDTPERPGLETAGSDVASTEWVDTAASAGAVYAYFVQARHDGQASPWSEPVLVKVEDTFPPPAPTGLTTVPALQSIELSWEAVASPDVSGYRVYRASSQDTWTVVADGVTVPAHSDRDVVSGRDYRYAVSAIDRSGNESARSQPVAVQAP